MHTPENNKIRPAAQAPLVSVCMLAYNVEAFIEQAIEGVLRQQIDFAIELVIGEDCSTDGTRAICARYAADHPGTVILLPGEMNLGIAGNAARTLKQCRGKYIAICDGDDIWADPNKLRNQVGFLEQNPGYGAVYTDVETISTDGAVIDDPEHQLIREQYASGNIFFKLLGGNFVNNSTAVFRQAFLDGYQIDCDRNYYTHDYLLWLHIATQSKIHFIDAKTTLYRKHAGGVTNSVAKLASNKQKFQYHLYKILLNFHQYYPKPITSQERMMIFQKMLSVLYRKENNVQMKARMLTLMPRYFPGVLGITKIVLGKIGLPLIHSLNDNVLTTNLE